MKSRMSVCMTAIAVLAGLAAPFRLAAQSQPIYVVTELGTLGGSYSAAISINSQGLLSGFSALPGNQTLEAVAWKNGKAIPLSTLGGPNSGIFWPNHTANAAVGIAESAAMDDLHEDWSCSYGGFFFPTVTGHICLGFVWQNGVMNPLPTLGGVNGYASGANHAGQVVGWAETPVHDPTCILPQVLQFEAVIWGPNKGRVQPLPPLGSDPDSAATAINDKGQVVGISGICENAVGDMSATHAVLWQNGAATDLGNIGGNAWNTPTAINQQGNVVGFAETASGGIHAFLWTPSGGMQDLGALPGDFLSFAYAINDHGQVVGQSIGPNGSRAVIWQNGKIMDVNSLAATGSPYLIYANDIDDSGMIVGQAFDSATGLAPGYVAVLSDTDDDSQGEASVTRARAAAAPVMLPPNISNMLRHAFNFGRLGPVR